jgi:hypothetical protein
MATRDVVPRANNEGNVGTTSKKWAAVNATALNELTMTKQTTGFTIAGGTTSKTLTVSGDASVSGTNTGDQDLSGYATKGFALAMAIALGG